MAKRTNKTSGFFHSGFGLALIAFLVLAAGYFIYSEHQKGVLGTSTQATSTNKCGYWMYKFSVNSYVSGGRYAKANFQCQDGTNRTSGDDGTGKTLSTWASLSLTFCKEHTKCQPTF